MNKAKVAVAVPVPLLEVARRAVRSGRARSVSAYVSAALEEKAKLDDLSALLDELLAASGGPLTDAERRRAKDALGLSGGRPRKQGRGRAA